MGGSDVWWHLAAGRWMAAHHALPLIDPWSFTAFGRSWLNHEWLGELLFGIWMRLWGMRSLVWFEWALVVAILTILMYVLRRLSEERATAWAVAAGAGAVASYFFEIRPHLFSLLCFVGVLALTLGRARASWWLPAVFLAAANLHAGYIFAFLALVLLIGFETLRYRRNLRHNLILGAACLAATLVTPEGAKIWFYTLLHAARPNLYVAWLPEWQSPLDPAALYAPLFPWAAGVFCLAAVATLWQARLRSRPFAIEGLLLGALTAAMAVKACRFIPLFALAGSLTVASTVGLAAAPLLRRIPALIPPLAVAAFGLFRLSSYPLGSAAFHHMTFEEIFPVDTCDFIDTNGLSGNLFNYYGWGGYVILRTDGRMKVFIDGRGSIVYEDETFGRYLRVLYGEPDWPEILEASGADYILWPPAAGVEMLQRLVDSGRWKLLHQDFVSVLLCRVDRLPPGPLRDPPPSAWRELADGGQASSEGRPAEAERHLRRALELKTDLRPAALGLASLLIDQGKRDEAVEVLLRQQRAYPTYEVRDALRHVRSGLSMAGTPSVR